MVQAMAGLSQCWAGEAEVPPTSTPIEQPRKEEFYILSALSLCGPYTLNMQTPSGGQVPAFQFFGANTQEGQA